MIKIYLNFFIIFCLFLMFLSSAAAAPVHEPVKAGDILPAFIFQAPYTAEEKEYLGLNDKDRFSLEELDAKFFLIEVVGVYCPICHIQSEQINRLFNKIINDEHLNNNLMMFSVSSGSTEMEVGYLRNTWQAPYPMAADPDYDFFNLIRAPGVPFSLIVSRDGSVHYSNQGRMPELEEFMELIKDIVR